MEGRKGQSQMLYTYIYAQRSKPRCRCWSEMIGKVIVVDKQIKDTHPHVYHARRNTGCLRNQSRTVHTSSQAPKLQEKHHPSECQGEYRPHPLRSDVKPCSHVLRTDGEKRGQGHRIGKKGGMSGEDKGEQKHRGEQEIKEHMPGTDTVANAQI